MEFEYLDKSTDVKTEKTSYLVEFTLVLKCVQAGELRCDPTMTKGVAISRLRVLDTDTKQFSSDIKVVCAVPGEASFSLRLDERGFWESNDDDFYRYTVATTTAEKHDANWWPEWSPYVKTPGKVIGDFKFGTNYKVIIEGYVS